MPNFVDAVNSRPFYMALGILMAAIAVMGFWPTYYGPLVTAALAQPVIIHWHALVFSGWLALFFAQAAFAAIGRVSIHIRLGRIGIAYAVCLIAVGLVTGVIRAGALELAEGAELLMAAILDMAVFALFFGLAIAYRKKPQVHKRAMIVAATMLLIAAAGRFWFLPDLAPAIRLPTFFLIWLSPILCAITFDLLRERRIYPIYVAGIAVLAMRIFVGDLISQTEMWRQFATGVFDFWNV